MILKAFKEKSNQKFINALLSKRKVDVNQGKIKTVGVLLDDEQYSRKDDFIEFFNGLNLHSSNQKFLTFSKNDTSSFNQWDSICISKDFGWNGKIKNNELLDFTNFNFDVLICYFLASDIELTQICAMSNANFKVGISSKDDRLYDLIIEITPNKFENFKTELKKYLTILNKL